MMFNTLIIREMQIQITVRHSDTPIRVAKIKTDSCKCWKRPEAPGTFRYMWWDVKWYHVGKQKVS